RQAQLVEPDAAVRSPVRHELHLDVARRRRRHRALLIRRLQKLDILRCERAQRAEVPGRALVARQKLDTDEVRRVAIRTQSLASRLGRRAAPSAATITGYRGRRMSRPSSVSSTTGPMRMLIAAE